MIDVDTLLSLTGEPVAQVPIVGFIGNLILAALLALVLADVYTRHGRSLTNRRTLASNFVLITITTMFIITVVKSSLALSLGLVGALSIVRFRTAIKEPEELSYLFLTIAVGLGLGADQVVITLVAFAFIIGITWLSSLLSSAQERSEMLLTVAGGVTESASLKAVVDLIQKHSNGAHLKRHDESREKYEGVFAVNFNDFDGISALKRDLKELDPNIRLTLIDNK